MYFTASQPREKGRCLAKNSQNSQFPTFNMGCKKFALRELFSSQPFPKLHVFTASQTRKNGRCLAKNRQNTQFATLNLGCKKSRTAQTFFIPAISHVTRLLPRSNHVKMAIAWTKTVKAHNLPRLIWAAKGWHGANSFHPSHFPRYTSFTASQPRKNGRCLAKNRQNTQFATFNLGCKRLALRKLFSSQPFPTLHVFYSVPTLQKWPLSSQKPSKHTICHV